MIATKRTTELVAGDIVLSHGMILRVETTPTECHNGAAVATDALVLNVDEVRENDFVPMSWLEREDGSKRWRIQGNDLAFWSVAHAMDVLFVAPGYGENADLFRVLDGEGRDVGRERFETREDAEETKRYLQSARRRIYALVQRSNAGDDEATEILFEIQRDGDPDEYAILRDFRKEAEEIVANGIGVPANRLSITAYGVANALGLAHAAKIAESFGTGRTLSVLGTVATERNALAILFPGANDPNAKDGIRAGYDEGMTRGIRSAL